MDRVLAQALAGPGMDWREGGMEQAIALAKGLLPEYGKLLSKTLMQKRGPLPVPALRLLAVVLGERIKDYVERPTCYPAPPVAVMEQLGVPATIQPKLLEVLAQNGVEVRRGRNVPHVSPELVLRFYRPLLYGFFVERGFTPRWSKEVMEAKS